MTYATESISTDQTATHTETPALMPPEKIAKDATLLGGYAYQILRQQAKRIHKLKSQVLADKDIEPLHQMRIGTRRLRSALMLFSDVIALDSSQPNSQKKKQKGSLLASTQTGDSQTDKNPAMIAQLTKSVKKLTQALGMVRDLDVMQEWFEQVLVPADKPGNNKTQNKSGASHFSKAEKKTIQALLKKLKKRRKKQFSRLEKQLSSRTYKTVIRQIKQWTKQPAFTAVAQHAANRDAAQRIIDPITQLISHPGWLMATHKQGQKVSPIGGITLPQLNQELEQKGQQLHALRKQIKQARYQAEFFRGLYGITYAAQIREFRTMQKILGELQDQIVVGEFLTVELGADWAEKLPTIEAAFQASRLELWQQWQPYQQKYLNLRSSLPQVITAA